jgi:hypothetical protein
LKPQAEDGLQAAATPASPAPAKKVRRGPYRPSHKATFIGLCVVVVILAINAGIIAFVITAQNKPKKVPDAQITISQDVLNKLGVSRNPVSDAGVELVVNPNAQFNGNLQIGGDVSVAGKLNINNTFSAPGADFTQLQAGNTSLSQLNVNGDGTISNLALRQNLSVVGTAQFQGAVTLAQILTVNSNVNIGGNLSVGGILAVETFHTAILVSDDGVTTGGHVITQGVAPTVSRGAAVGPNGTVSISGNDISGTVAANFGVGASAGVIASVTFHTAYSNIPHVVFSTDGILPAGVSVMLSSRSASGFTIYINGAVGPSGFVFDYIVEQ